MSIENELNDLISEIPEEIKDCFGIYISKENGQKLIDNFCKKLGVNEPIYFPITYKNIPVAIHEYKYTKLELIKTKDKATKVYLYEKNNLEKYLKELDNISKKYQCYIRGCGCCGSPFINNLHTITVDDINFENNKLEYKVEIKEYIRSILDRGELIMTDLIFIFLGGMLCSASIILVLFQKPKVIDRYTIRIVDERRRKKKVCIQE